MRLLAKARPLPFLGIVLAMILGVSSAALAEDPAVQETDAPAGVTTIEEGEVIPRDDGRPSAVEPDIAPEPEIEEPLVIAPGSGIEEPMVVNPAGTIGIDEELIAPSSTADHAWSAGDWTILGGSIAGALLLGAGIAFVATRQHYRHHPLPH